MGIIITLGDTFLTPSTFAKLENPALLQVATYRNSIFPVCIFIISRISSQSEGSLLTYEYGSKSWAIALVGRSARQASWMAIRFLTARSESSQHLDLRSDPLSSHQVPQISIDIA